jgi:hypothetical protein
MTNTQTFPTRKQIAIAVSKGIISSHEGIILRGKITQKEKEITQAQKKKETINKTKELYKELIPVIDGNLRYLKSCLDLTEAHITWGTKNVKKKYSGIKVNILNKIKEQLIDKRKYTRFLEI